MWRRALKKYLKKYPEVQLTGYQWMSNHCHMIIALDDKEGSAKKFTQFMHDLNWRFAWSYNKKHGRRGHFFQSRYRCTVLNSEEYIVACQRYIYRNPVRARMVTTPGENLFGSYHHYAYRRIDCLITDFANYEGFGNTSEERAKAFRQYVETMSEVEEREMKQKLKRYRMPNPAPDLCVQI
jgi:putative transposase